MTVETIGLIAGIVLTIGSEVIALNPKWKSNSWVQLIGGLLRRISGRKFSVLLVIISIGMIGCAPKPYIPPEECNDSQSLILATINSPAALSKGLLAVNLVALESIRGYGPDDATAVLDKIEENLTMLGMTYAEMVGYVMSKIKLANALAGAAVFVMGDEITALDSPAPVSPCDIALVRLHLQKQRALVALYSAGK